MPHYFIKRLRIVNHYTAALTRSVHRTFIRAPICSSTERTTPERRKRRAAHPAGRLAGTRLGITHSTAENTAKSENDMPHLATPTGNSYYVAPYLQ